MALPCGALRAAACAGQEPADGGQVNTEVSFPPFLVRQEDERNWVLYRQTDRLSQKGANAGQPIMEHLGYYGDLQAALRSGLRHGMKGLGPVSPKQIIEHIDICYQRINEAVSE